MTKTMTDSHRMLYLLPATDREQAEEVGLWLALIILFATKIHIFKVKSKQPADFL